ncbi:MAG: aminotransferase class I/II-fold pyridoxal phosphate-dependent enzyme [Ruminiclostridium sp.]|jgi:aspartate/methionine/tyrosine aminotransferase|nr:aminotransferase class I/II-fold pyridoxal phosphate-dependent enzyme [Ruminiclostridium sp.]
MTELLNRNLLSLDPHDPQRFVALAKNTEDCLLLTLSEPDFGISDVVRTNIPKSLEIGRTHYVPNPGDDSMRVAVADFERRTLGLDYSYDEVITTVGGTEALFLALQGTLNLGDEVIIPRPAIDLYENITRLSGATPVFLDTTEDSYQIQGEKLNALVTDKTKAIVLNSPNNPTGTILTAESLQAVRDAVAGKPIFVICDDVYNRVVYEGTCPSFAATYPELKEQTLVVQSFSNSYAMAGFRMGYLLGAKAVIEKLSFLHTATVNSVVAFNQDAAINALHSDIMGMVWAYDSRRKFMEEKLTALGLDYVAPQGAFYIFPSIQKFGLDSETFCTRMIQEAKVAVLPGSCYGAEGYVRISYSAPMGNLRAAMVRFENFIKSL